MILDLSKTVVYDFSYDYKKQKYRQKSNWCYMDTDSFITHTKTEDVSKDISEDVEKRFGTSNYELGRLLPIGDNEKVIGETKDELSGQIMKKLLRYNQKLKFI